jgi:tetratricopeptide (TPR) repeat protein
MPKPQRGRSPHTEPSQSSPTLASGFNAIPADQSKSSRRATYPEAVAGYERGVRALQEHRYQDAADAFRKVLTQFPEEKELNDRVRLYLALCDRHLQAAPEPKTLDEQLYAATLALNAGDRLTARRHLDNIVAQDPDHDAALYMLGVVHALSDDPEQAVGYLRRAIQQNPDNRALAFQDSDLERLMQDEAIRAALDATASSPADMRAPTRPRPIR